MNFLEKRAVCSVIEESKNSFDAFLDKKKAQFYTQRQKIQDNKMSEKELDHFDPLNVSLSKSKFIINFASFDTRFLLYKYSRVQIINRNPLPRKGILQIILDITNFYYCIDLLYS